MLSGLSPPATELVMPGCSQGSLRQTVLSFAELQAGMKTLLDEC
jgi:hypothetical protein